MFVLLAELENENVHVVVVFSNVLHSLNDVLEVLITAIPAFQVKLDTFNSFSFVSNLGQILSQSFNVFSLSNFSKRK